MAARRRKARSVREAAADFIGAAQGAVDRSGGGISSVSIGTEGNMTVIASDKDPEAEVPYVPRVRAPADHKLALPQSVDEDGVVLEEYRPDDQFPVPSETRFAFSSYLEAPDLAEMADALIATHPAFHHIDGVTFNILWREEGGESAGCLVYGRCNAIAPTNPLRFATGWVFYIWIAADHTRNHRFSRYQMEALLDHELSHVLFNEAGNCKIRGHDVEEFMGTIKRHGLWAEGYHDDAGIWTQARMRLDD